MAPMKGNKFDGSDDEMDGLNLNEKGRASLYIAKVQQT
jgi:hypothetical protein